MSEEIKPNLNINYLSLVTITAIITLIVTLVGTQIFNYYFNSSRKIIAITKNEANNLIDFQAKDEISAIFTLKKDSSQKIKSYFSQNIKIENIGDEPLKDFRLVISVVDKNVKLINTPIIKTIPSEIIEGKEIIKDSLKSTSNKHTYKIDLLDKNEILTFDYTAYAISDLKNLDFNVLVVKEGWEKKININKIEKSNINSIWIPFIINIIIMIISIIWILIRRNTLNKLSLDALSLIEVQKKDDAVLKQKLEDLGVRLNDTDKKLKLLESLTEQKKGFKDISENDNSTNTNSN